MRRPGAARDGGDEADHIQRGAQQQSQDVVRLLSLRDVNTFLVRQHVEHAEVLTGGMIETENKYSVLSARDGQAKQEYILEESSGFLVRMLCRNKRPFTMTMNSVSSTDSQVFNAARGLVGTVTVDCVCSCTRSFTVRDNREIKLCKIKRPLCSPWTFTVYKGGRAVGEIKKQWAGLIQEAFTNADNFGIQFDLDLDSQTKALLLGAVILIDFMFFEDSGSNKTRGSRGSRRMF